MSVIPTSPAHARIDRWLWAARAFRSRSLAAQACDGGKVTVNGRPPSPTSWFAPAIDRHHAVRRQAHMARARPRRATRPGRSRAPLRRPHSAAADRTTSACPARARPATEARRRSSIVPLTANAVPAAGRRDQCASAAATRSLVAFRRAMDAAFVGAHSRICGLRRRASKSLRSDGSKSGDAASSSQHGRRRQRTSVIDVTDADFEARVIERSQAGAGRRRLLGPVVRTVQRARTAARAPGRRARRRVRARQGEHRREPRPGRARFACRASRW